MRCDNMVLDANSIKVLYHTCVPVPSAFEKGKKVHQPMVMNKEDLPREAVRIRKSNLIGIDSEWASYEYLRWNYYNQREY